MCTALNDGIVGAVLLGIGFGGNVGDGMQRIGGRGMSSGVLFKTRWGGWNYLQRRRGQEIGG